MQTGLRAIFCYHMKTGATNDQEIPVPRRLSVWAILLFLQIAAIPVLQWINIAGAVSNGYYVLGISSLITFFLLHRDLSRSAKNRGEEPVSQPDKKTIEVAEVLENIPDGYLELDKDGYIIYFNQVAVRKLGNTTETLYGKHISQVFDETACQPFYQAMTKLREKGTNQNFDLYVPCIEKWLETHLHLSAELVLVFFEDITTRKKQEALLKLFESVISRSSDSILITNAELIDQPGPQIVYANEAFSHMTGYSLEEVVGATPRILQGAQTSRKELDRIREALQQWQPVEVELLNYKKNGETFWVSISIMPIPDEKGRYTNWIGIQQDITKRKTAEEALQVRNRELMNLSSYLQNVRENERTYIAREVHDELGQLASALKMDIDWLSIRFAGGEELGKKRISHATRTLEIMLGYIQKIAADLRPSILDDFGLNVALQWHCSEFYNMNGIECIFESTLDDNDLQVSVQTKLFRIVQESLNNVRRHADASSVYVTLLDEGDRICLSVMDNGSGFETSEKRNTLGLLGLRERAISMGGELRIESKQGKGTTVIAYIPKKLTYENSDSR